MNSASMVPVAALLGLEKVINAALRLDPATLKRLGAHEGRIVAIQLKGTNVRIYLVPGTEGVQLMAHFDGEPDTLLKGTPLGLMRLSLGEAGAGMFSGEVEIEGDVELGQRIKGILERIDIDWEEHLSRLTGDIIAHQVGNAVRGLFGWGRDAGESLGLDVADYLKEEARVVPPVSEVEAFLKAVDELRLDADRLEARIERLRRRS